MLEQEGNKVMTVLVIHRTISILILIVGFAYSAYKVWGKHICDIYDVLSLGFMWFSITNMTIYAVAL